MSNPISFSGLSSGIQWGDIVDKLNAAQQAREVTPITKSIDAAGKRRTAWNDFQTKLYGLNDAARVLRNGSVGALTTSAGTSPNTSRTLFSATAGLVASPGTYQVEVAALAQQDKVGGNVVTDVAAAAGIDGTFTVNGATVTVAATDSLNGIRDKINATNSGSTPSGVTASILSNGGSAGRLVMTASATGANGITLTDGASGTARSLGLLDTTSRKLTSISTAVATVLGISPPPAPASIVVGGLTIAISSSDSLATIMAKINAAGGQSSIKTEPNGAGSLYSLVVSDNVQAVSGDSDSAAWISTLGLTAGGRSSVQQTVASGIMTEAGGSLASSSTGLTNLSVAGVAANIAVGDAINIRGTRGDGTVASVGITVGAGDTVQTLLDKINSAPGGFGGGSRTATASLGSDGKIRLVDDTGGESKLTLFMDVTKTDGTSGTLGTTSTERLGRERAVAIGSNADLKIDGVSYSRSSNTVGDVIPGVTLNLQQAEAGTSTAFQVSRDTATITASIKKMVDAYNSTFDYFDAQRKDPTQPLYGNPTLRTVMNSMSDALRTVVSSNSVYTVGSVAGMTLDRSGHLNLDTAALTTALGNKPEELAKLFGSAGIGQALVTATDKATAFGTGVLATQINSIDSSVATMKSRQTVAQRRVDDAKKQMTARFTSMEQLLAKIQSQGSAMAKLASNSN